MPRRSLSATYRLQLRGPDADPHGRSFTFADAKAIVPYLNELGVSHLYLSPILTAPSSSNHNYDVIDPTEVNPALGGTRGIRGISSGSA
ncbi:alpha-amylase family glycosyl hydrolase [Corynebacterium parakroppenstedtii]|uniref:alpha-amylase family glycosyl hydrolase n=1 Tax=Corynebacterium parakroppenstedtii TaxID=2828363 RepID=UPI0030EF184F